MNCLFMTFVSKPVIINVLLNQNHIFSLQIKDEAADFLETDTIKNLVRKYSQFINFPIYLWSSKTVEASEELNENKSVDTEIKKKEKGDSKKLDENQNDVDIDDEDIEVEDVKDEIDKKKVHKTVWDWELLNDSKPIWTLKPSEVTDTDYDEFYKALTKDNLSPLAKIHFIAEGEVTFKSLLFIPQVQPGDSFNRYGKKDDNIKLYVRRVFIADKFNDLMPSYLAFIQGIVDSDDLPLNVSRENLQQHKLIKIIKKKLVRKVLDMIKKIPKQDYDNFWKEYSTNIKLGIMEDAQNRARLSKLLMFRSSVQEKPTSLSDYVSRMKPNQQNIYYIAGSSLDEVKISPFAERLLKKGYEVLYLVEAVDEYALSNIPEYDGKKFQNIAKEGFTLDEGTKAAQKKKELENTFEPLIQYLNENLKNYITKAQISERLSDSPCALIASMFGWTGNMERLALSNAHQKTDDPQKSYYLNQKKTLEINPRHPLIRELLRRIEKNEDNETTLNMALLMFQTATLRSGYMLKEATSFSNSVEILMKKTLGIPEEEEVFEAEDDEIISTDDIEEEPDSYSYENIKKDDHDEL